MAYIPHFHVTQHLLKLIEELSAYRQKIISATLQVPWIPLLQRDARARNTHSSTAIEGNPLTLEEVEALVDGRSLPEASKRARREILNQLAGLKFIEKNQKRKAISQSDLFRLHKLIATHVMDQGKPGQYRTFGVRVGSYLPPPAKEVPKLMQDYLQWWNRKAQEWSAVISSAILHYRFEAIHPFGDGNGRMGRAIALWELYRRGFDTHHIFSVDEVYWENRPRYYAQLDAVRKSNSDLTGWLEYSAEALHLTLERVLKRIDRLSIKQIGGKIVLTKKQEKLLHLLKDKGGMFPAEIWKELNITKQGTMKILKPLIAAGLIQRIGTRKSGKYEILLK
ncbi:MAG: Fic family protein [Deltaproteobacteria bacterium]|nr:Fic family protein [Deltaproteobacteria bacterium]